jgi:general secretion pathway protein D
MHVPTLLDRFKLLVLLCLTLVLAESAYGQAWQERRELREYSPPDAIVSMERHLTFDQAIEALNELSKKFTGKVIVDPGQHTKAIGVHIESLHWRDALERILRHHRLWYDERADHFLVKTPVDLVEREAEVVIDPERPTLQTREVNISAVFFEVSHRKLQESGIRWSVMRTGDRNFERIGGGVATARDPEIGFVDRIDRAAEISVIPALSFANIDALLQLFAGSDIGEVISSPDITVRSGQTGSIQVGEDISIKQRDFAGNIIDVFVNTGTIINVSPEVIVEDGIPFISLDVSAERSTGTPGIQSTIIAKAEAQTRVLLLDGEETIIGGLFVTEDRVVREGVPVLKDLPWWFFGLKYIFGYNRVQKDKQELIILLKASLVPTLEERIATMRERNLLQERRRQNQEDLDRLRSSGDVKKE